MHHVARALGYRVLVRSSHLRSTVGVLLAVLVAGCGFGAEATREVVSDERSSPASTAGAATPSTAPTVVALAGDAAREPGVHRRRPRTPSWKRRLRLIDTIGGEISPKSVVASGDGLFLAQNMMYRHTITAYDRKRRLLATIPDEVDLSSFGFKRHAGRHRGAPVEAAFSPSGDHAYVSNYSMYGPGFGPEGSDSCTPADGTDASFVYRIDTETLEIDDAIKVGAVPKYVATSPDGRWVLVTNWCTYDLSVIDVAKGRQVRRIELGAYPRGIAIDAESTTAYVAIMGGTRIAAVDLDTFAVEWIEGVGQGPRDLRISPDGRFLYATLNAEGTVAKIHLGSRRVRARASAGQAPRSMAISDDGTALYVVNYNSDTVSKIRTRDMRVVQTVDTNTNPIGITYDPESRQLWVACYSGSIMVLKDGRHV